MTARRRRDPRLPHDDPLEDVETIVDGEVVRKVGLTMADELIIAANQSELDIRRVMWGLDVYAWLLPVLELARDGELDAARVIARRICDTSTTLVQYDTREPNEYAWEVLAWLHHKAGDHQAEAAALQEFLSYWPDTRKRTNGARERIRTKLEKGCR